MTVADSSLFDFERDSVLRVQVQAIDKGGLRTRSQLSVRILNINEAPDISGLQDTLIQEDAIIQGLSFSVRDPESSPDELNYYFATSNRHLLPRSGIFMIGAREERRLRVYPVENKHGSVQITMVADDGSLADTARWTLTIQSVNDKPVLRNRKVVHVQEGGLTNITKNQLRATDIDHESIDLTYQLLKKPKHGRFGFNTAKQAPSLSFSQLQLNQRMIWYQHDGSEQHKDTVWLSLSDPLGAKIDSIALPIDIEPINKAPNISTLNNESLQEDGAPSIQSVRVWDAESTGTELMVWGASDNPNIVPDSLISISGIDQLRKVKVSPAPNAYGEARIRIHVSDGQDTTATSFWLNIVPVNDPPRLASHDELKIPEDTTQVSYKLGIRDIDTPLHELDIQLNSTDPRVLPNDSLHLTIREDSYWLAFQPKPNQFGNTIVEYQVSDGEFTRHGSLPIQIESINDAPNPFDLFTAQPQVVDDSLKVEFRWDQSTDVEDQKLEYMLYIYSNEFDTLITGLNQTKAVFQARRILESNTEYIWQVRVTDGIDTTASKQEKAFLTPALPELPTEFALEQNYPNPFNPTTTITYRLPVTAHVRLSVYDMSGRLLNNLVRTVQNPGVHHVQWNAENQASGIYMYRIVARGIKNDRRFSETDKMMLIK